MAVCSGTRLLSLESRLHTELHNLYPGGSGSHDLAFIGRELTVALPAQNWRCQKLAGSTGRGALGINHRGQPRVCLTNSSRILPFSPRGNPAASISSAKSPLNKSGICEPHVYAPQNPSNYKPQS